MKKLFIIVALACVSAVAGAQNWKVEAGLGFAKYGGDVSLDPAFSYSVGAGYECKLNDKWSIQPNAFLTKKGGKENGVKSRANYLEIPVFISYRINCGDFNVVPQVGPYVAYGLWGKTKSDGSKFDTFSNNLLDEKDWGFQVRADLEYENYLVGVRYHFGLSDNNNSVGGSIKNRGLLFCFGYRF